VARVRAARRRRIIWFPVILLVLVSGAAASGATAQGKDILVHVQRFMLFYSGVLALIALTAAVGAGIVATDRIVMAPASRVVAQAVHRAVSFGALAFLVTHIVLEILAHRSHVVDAFVPFLAHGRTFYVGLGTVASDLVVLLVVTGIARGRFAARRPWTWRAIHATAYLCWPLSIVHGLLAGRTAKPYVDWSYGACLAAVALALLIRLVATVRSRREKAAHPLPDYISSTVQAPMPAMAQHDALGRLGAAPPAPHAYDPRGAMPQARPSALALPAGAASGPADPYAQAPYANGRPAAYPQAPYIAARRLATPRPDLPIPDQHQQLQRSGQRQQQRPAAYPAPAADVPYSVDTAHGTGPYADGAAYHGGAGHGHDADAADSGYAGYPGAEGS
jgi:DMSO/TMAO reductase YedYZ heme-binding membrane subunit